MKNFALINGKVVSHQRVFDGTVFVKDGLIDRIEEKHFVPEGVEVIDVAGKYILPGAIDVHVHFRTPGQTEKEDWQHGSKAALAGGVTTVFDMPNNVPSIIDQESLDAKRELIKGDSLVDYGLYVGATNDNVSLINDIKGIVGVKVFMGSSTGSLLVDDLNVLDTLLKDSDRLFAMHAENERCILDGLAHHEGEEEASVHSKIRNPNCAYQAVKDVLHIAKKYLSRVHICHLSTEVELDTVRKFKSENVSVEVAPHHLFFTDNDYDKYGNLIKMNPPVRSSQDVKALWDGINDGTVDMVSTDHAPHLLEDKNRSYSSVPSGVPGVQTMLPLLLNSVNDGMISLEKVVELTSKNPAQKFKINNKGMLVEGYDADIVVVDMDLKEPIRDEDMYTKCGWSPYSGMDIMGWPVLTFVRGEKMYEWKGKFGDSIGKEVVCG